MRNEEERTRNYSEEGKNALSSAWDKLKNNKQAKIGAIALIALIAISVLAHFYA